jgi:hypothetical protein|tara:strand:- start:2817 stop:3041 length:225 start_codon:yes stop_codon:yes gene_type:complete
MIINDTRRGDRESDLLNALIKMNGRKSFDEGGEVKPVIDLAAALKLGITLSNLTDAERESVRFALEKMKEVPKK